MSDEQAVPIQPAPAPATAVVKFEDSVVGWQFRGIQEFAHSFAGKKHNVTCFEVQPNGTLRVYFNGGENFPLVKGFKLVPE